MRSRSLWNVPLLLALLAPSLATDAPAEPEAWKESDRADDLKTPDAPAPVPLPSYLDIRSLSIHSEDEVSLVVDVEVGDFEREGMVLVSFGERGTLSIEFSLAGTPVTYQAVLELSGGSTPGSVPVLWFVSLDSFCADLGDGECRAGHPRLDVDAATNVFRLTISKSDLRGDGPTVHFVGRGTPTPAPEGDGEDEPAEPAELRVGSKLTGFVVRTDGNVGPLLATDALPDAGAIDRPFVLAFATANLGLSVSIDMAWNDEFAVVAGKNQTVPFRVSNQDGPKRIVLLTYEFVGADTSGYRVVAPANLSLPSYETREYRAYVFTPDVLKPVKFVIRARSVGLPDIGMAKAHLIPGLPFGPETPPLQILQRTSAELVPGACLYCYPDAVLYGGPAYQEYKAEGSLALVWGGIGFTTPGRSADQIHLKPATPVEMQLRVTSSRERADVRLSVQLDYMGQTLVQGTQEQTVGPDGVVFTFKKIPKLPEKVMPSQGLFDLQVEGPYDGSLLDQDALRIDLSQSLIKIPFAPVPEEYLEKPLASPFQISVLGEPDAFVNPGEARLFNLSVLNYDAHEQRVRLDASASAGAWDVEVLPGRLFDLGPGESVTVGVLVRPSAEAKDGDKVQVTFNATADNGAYSSQKVVVTLISFDVEDDTGRYVALPEDVEKQVDRAPRGRAPGAPLAASWAAFAVAAALARRRRPTNS